MTVATQDTPRAVSARFTKAQALLAGAHAWLKIRYKDGRKYYGIPSGSRPGHYWQVNTQTCDCPDHTRRELDCKHILAVRLHVSAVKAAQAATVIPTPIATCEQCGTTVSPDRALCPSCLAAFAALFAGEEAA